LAEWKKMQDIGVDIMRISPQAENTLSTVKQFADALAGHSLPLSLPEGQCNGYWYGKPGMELLQLETIS
jgi:collagenase-like PrtC family protease